MASYSATDLSAPYVHSVTGSEPVAVVGHGSAPFSEPADTVHLSEAAQVLQLSQEGQSASQIGSSLGLTTAEVNADLGQIVAAALAAPSAAAAPVDTAQVT
jgi:hypothetical protein